MIIPTRCFTCGTVLSDKWPEFQERTGDGEDAQTVLDELGLDRYCCRTVFLTHVNLAGDVAEFKK